MTVPRSSPTSRLGAVLLVTLCLLAGCAAPDAPGTVDEELIRHNILGTAYLGQQKWTEAEESFREASLLSPEEPLLLNNASVALVQQGTTRKQRIYIETLGSLADLAQREQLQPPTIIIVGEVVSLQEKLSWFGEHNRA